MASTTTTTTDALTYAFPDPTNVLISRLENWRHVVTLVQDYLDAQIATQHSIVTGLEKTRKAVADAPRFDFAEGSTADSAVQESGSGPVGIAETFSLMRHHHDALLNKASETESALKSSVAPQLETLKGDIEKHLKGLKSSGLKGQKDHEKAKTVSQKHIETLGQYVASAGAGTSNSIRSDAKTDPYVLHRQAVSALDDQLVKENSQLDAIHSSQKNFVTLETHVIQVLQQAASLIETIQTDYAQAHAETYSIVAGSFAAITPDHEWNNFSTRNSTQILPPTISKRTLATTSFANDSHPATVPLIEGILQRKSGKLAKSYKSAYYVVTPAGFLHEFKSKDRVLDPLPELSMYLPECTLGPPSTFESGNYKFQLQGKHASSNISLGTKHTEKFKTSTYDEHVAWYTALKRAMGISGEHDDLAAISSASPVSPMSPATTANANVPETVPAAAPVAASQAEAFAPVAAPQAEAFSAPVAAPAQTEAFAAPVSAPAETEIFAAPAEPENFAPVETETTETFATAPGEADPRIGELSIN